MGNYLSSLCGKRNKRSPQTTEPSPQTTEPSPQRRKKSGTEDSSLIPAFAGTPKQQTQTTQQKGKHRQQLKDIPVEPEGAGAGSLQSNKTEQYKQNRAKFAKDFPEKEIKALNLGAGNNPMRSAPNRTVTNVDLAPHPLQRRPSLPSRLHVNSPPPRRASTSWSPPVIYERRNAAKEFPESYTGKFEEVHAINPHRFNPVNPHVNKVLKDKGQLLVTGQESNQYATNVKTGKFKKGKGRKKEGSLVEPATAGFDETEQTKMHSLHNFGAQKKSNGEPIKTDNSLTKIYNKRGTP